MKCFIHKNKDAIAVCKHCGKAMCDDCSSYSEHSGICPECRLNGFKEEVPIKLEERKDLIWGIVLQVLLCITLIWIPIAAFLIYGKIRAIIDINNRIQLLKKEIARLEEILTTTGGKSFK